jgi:calcineurin-like phosphoesterase family protein
MVIWFWSDTHFGHWNIVEHCHRPFINLVEMDTTIIKKFNERVSENDLVFFLGDFCMKKSSEASDAPQNAFDYYRNQLVCKNIIFIGGNHDKNNGTKTPIESINIEHGGFRIHLTHNPRRANEDFKFNYCGHCHGNEGTFRKLGRKSIIVDLSVENWDYYPVNINDINQAYSSWLKKGKKNE